MKKAVAEGPADLAFIGESITQGWSETQARRFAFGPYSAINMGISGDRTQHILWRLQNGMLGDHPYKAIVVMIGINNLNGDESAEDTAEGAQAILAELRKRQPQTPIFFLACFPGGPTADCELRKKVNSYHELTQAFADDKRVHVIDMRSAFLNADGTPNPQRMRGDNIHITQAGYDVWKESLLRYMPLIINGKKAAITKELSLLSDNPPT
jgi:lysophospholipase L1-like esterase